MKVLWITNIVFPEANEKLTGSGTLKASGGWLLGAANALLDNYDIDLYIATVTPLVKSLTKLQGERSTFYLIPFGKGNHNINLEYCKYWTTICQEINPNIVHIHGTEFSHGYAFLKACNNDNVVISVQGLTSACSTYYHLGISVWDIISNLTLHDLLRGSMIRDKWRYKRRGEFEKWMLNHVHYIIGRTSWDRARTCAINPSAKYFACNEILRSEFYTEEKWSYENCVKHTIFLSQASYPIKGLHQVLKAMPLILNKFPDTQLRIAGCDITRNTTFHEKIRYTGYGRYIKRSIRKMGLEGKVTFLGNLNALEMKREYLNANLFICPSTIENSPNSLGEAQILGTPCVASYVGGVPDMMVGNEENLYRFEEIEMLSEKVCGIFQGKNKQADMSGVANLRHDIVINARQLFNIYKQIMCLK